jgi:hypothetical protein
MSYPGQMSLADVIEPTVRVIKGPDDRPRAWVIDYADGRQVLARRTDDPRQWWTLRSDEQGEHLPGGPVPAYSIPYPAALARA